MPWLTDNMVQRLRRAAEAPDLSATKYRLLEKFSRGGMGTIYLAEDAQLQRRVALKVMHLADPTGEQAARMLREAQVIAQLEHPGIVPVHDVGELPDGRVFYVMKFVQGQRLDAYTGATPSLLERLRAFQKICEAVAFAHANGVIHRDLKPENIMVGAFGEVLVMDWGLAKIVVDKSRIEDRETRIVEDGSWIVDPSSIFDPQSSVFAPARPPHQTEHGTIMGTPAYMSPEQRRGDIDAIDHRSDVYALGAILKFLLRTTTSAASDSAEKDAGTEIPRPRKIPKHLAAICAQALAEEKSQRYANVLDLAADIDRFLNGLAVSSYKENLFEKLWRRIKQYQFMILLVLIYLVVRVLLYWWLQP